MSVQPKLGHWGLLPRRTPAILALLLIGWCFQFVIEHETPVGRIEGRITLAETHRVMPGAEITLTPHYGRRHRRRDANAADARKTRRAVSDRYGNFVLNNVPTGEYDIVAASNHHEVPEVRIQVDEGQATPIQLDLKRSEPGLALKEHQRVYGTDERAHLSISGYVDPSRPLHADSVQIKLYRTVLSHILQNSKSADALEEVGRGYDAAPRLPTALLHPADHAAPVKLFGRDERIKGEDIEGFYYQDIDLSRLEAGLYLVDLRHGMDTACAWLLVTDTAIVLKRAPNRSLAFVVDMKSGLPVAGSEVRVYGVGGVLSRSVTDVRGLAEVKFPPQNHEKRDREPSLTTVAIRGRDEAVVARGWYRSESADDYAVHAYTDRTIYRPGQRINFKAIVRRRIANGSRSPLAEDTAGTAAPRRWSVPAGVPIRVELRDKSGERLLNQTYTTNRYGSISGFADLLNEAITGTYTLILHLDGEEHTQDVVVAAYHKPEFAVTVKTDRDRYIRGEPVTVTLAGSYYFGSPVAGAKVIYSVYSSPDWAAEYGGADRDDDEADDETGGTHDRSESYYGGSVTEGTATLDASGRAVFTFRAQDRQEKDNSNAKNDSDDDNKADDKSDSNAQDTPPEMIYTVHATVTEGEDREVEADGQARVVQGDFRLSVAPEGYLAMPGRPTNVVVTARDYNGNPIAHLPLSLESGYEHWRDDHYKYTSIGAQSAVTGDNGQAVIAVTPPKTGQLRLIAHTKDGAGHSIAAHAELWSASDGAGDMDTTYNDLSLLTDRRHYEPGQTARVLINAARVGETVLLTVEGDRIYHAQTLQIDRRSTTIEVPIREEYGPNAFLSACYVRAKHFCTSEAPLRVALPDSALKVSVRADREAATATDPKGAIPKNTVLTAKYVPGDRVTYFIQTTDRQGRPLPSEFSLGVVDESIYALREDDPKALRDAFYPHRTNYVTTLYSFAAEYLGDADKSEPQIAARHKFLDTADWEPNLQTNEHGIAVVHVTLPDNLTTWRATVTAHTLDTRVGRAIDKIVVTKPFFVRLETPRTLTQRDQTTLLAAVHNETGQPQTVRVHLHAKGLTIGSLGEQELAVPAGAIGTATWPVTAEICGNAKLKVTAWTVSADSAQRYTDGLETTLPVRAHGREEATAFAGELTASNPETEVVHLDPDVVPGSARLTVHITPSVGTALAGSLDYLIGYPYGCVEQTMSRLLPDMLAQRALRQAALPPLSEEKELPQMVREGLQRLYRFQHESGAWGWWEHDADDPWMTAYVLYGLHTADMLGYKVSPQVFERGRKAAVKMIRKVTPSQRPFVLYALALCGERTVVEAERGHLRLESMDPEGLAYVVLTDAALGRSTAATWAELSRRAVDADSAVHWPVPQRWDGDDQTATAVGLRALLTANRQDPRLGSVLRWLMRKRTGDYWSNTRDTSCVLAALCDYLAAFGPHQADGEVCVTLNGRPVGTYQLSDANLREKELTLRIPGSDLRPGKNDVMLTREGGNSVVFYSVELRQTVASEALLATSLGKLSVKREYLRLVNHRGANNTWSLTTEPTDNHLVAGQPIRVRLTIDAPRDMEYVLIEDAFPAGCEVSERGDADDVTDWSYWWSSVDVRDDRIAYFARNLPKGRHVIDYNLRAQTPGDYHTMPTLVQPMYAPELRALSDEARVEIGK